MPTNQERIQAIVDLGTTTARTSGGWQLDNIRIAQYPDGHWVIASLGRDELMPVVHAVDDEVMMRVLKELMTAISRRVTFRQVA